MPKTQAEIDLEYLNSKYGKNELLHQALDRAVLRGAMRVEAVADAMDLFGDKCVVDPTHLDVTLNGQNLDAAVEKLIEARPLWRVSGPDPAVVARKELEAEALAGNASAHGRLYMSLGSTKAERDRNYAEWKLKHGAQPGKAAAVDTAIDDAARAANDDRKNNPFSKEGWSITKQGALLRAIGETKTAQIAASVNSRIGATRPSN